MSATDVVAVDLLEHRLYVTMHLFNQTNGSSDKYNSLKPKINECKLHFLKILAAFAINNKTLRIRYSKTK